MSTKTKEPRKSQSAKSRRRQSPPRPATIREIAATVDSVSFEGLPAGGAGESEPSARMPFEVGDVVVADGASIVGMVTAIQGDAVIVRDDHATKGYDAWMADQLTRRVSAADARAIVNGGVDTRIQDDHATIPGDYLRELIARLERDQIGGSLLRLKEVADALLLQPGDLRPRSEAATDEERAASVNEFTKAVAKINEATAILSKLDEGPLDWFDSVHVAEIMRLAQFTRERMGEALIGMMSAHAVDAAIQEVDESFTAETSPAAPAPPAGPAVVDRDWIAEFYTLLELLREHVPHKHPVRLAFEILETRSPELDDKEAHIDYVRETVQMFYAMDVDEQRRISNGWKPLATRPTTSAVIPDATAPDRITRVVHIHEAVGPNRDEPFICSVFEKNHSTRPIEVNVFEFATKREALRAIEYARQVIDNHWDEIINAPTHLPH